jgi:hypothetical protein
MASDRDLELKLSTEIWGSAMSKIVLAIPCEHCRARAGEPCRNRDGESLFERLPIRVHIHRIAPVWVIYKVGYHAGGRDMKEKLKRGTHRDEGL